MQRIYDHQARHAAEIRISRYQFQAVDQCRGGYHDVGRFQARLLANFDGFGKYGIVDWELRQYPEYSGESKGIRRGKPGKSQHFHPANCRKSGFVILSPLPE